VASIGLHQQATVARRGNASLRRKQKVTPEYGIHLY
jgi:hypothetical protein